MALFNKQTQPVALTDEQKLLKRYNGARSNILLVVAFTLVNSILLIAGSDSYFLFSAAVPYYITFFSMLYTGRMPAEYYEGVECFEPMADRVFYAGLAIAAVVVLVYALCWFLSKKRGFGWLVFALVIFVIDTVAMFWFGGFSADSILDIVFHGWVIVSLISGISALIKLKKLPENSAPSVQYAPVYQDGVPVYSDSSQAAPYNPYEEQAAPAEECPPADENSEI